MQYIILASPNSSIFFSSDHMSEMRPNKSSSEFMSVHLNPDNKRRTEELLMEEVTVILARRCLTRIFTIFLLYDLALEVYLLKTYYLFK